MNITIGLALLVVCATVYALIKRYETRLVLLTAGLVMTLIAMDPMAAFKQFDKSMTNGSLIIAICSALGFAGVISLTGCDRHLVRLLTKPLGKLGIFLLPACILVGFVVATAIPSMAGMSAAVGPTLIPLLVRAGFRPAMAAAAVASCVMAGYFNPGVSHNPFIAKLAGMEVMEFVGGYANVTFMVCGCLVVLMTGVCVAYGDFKKGGFEDAAQTEEEHQDEKVNVLCALAPLVPGRSASGLLLLHSVRQDLRCDRHAHRHDVRDARHPRRPAEDHLQVLRRHGQGLRQHPRHHHCRRRVRLRSSRHGRDRPLRQLPDARQ